MFDWEMRETLARISGMVCKVGRLRKPVRILALAWDVQVGRKITIPDGVFARGVV
jgi:ribosomal protein L18E